MHLVRNFGLYVVGGIIVVGLMTALEVAQRHEAAGAYVPSSPHTALNARAEANLARLEQRSNAVAKSDQLQVANYAYVVRYVSDRQVFSPVPLVDEPPEEAAIHRQIQAELPPKR